jgi:hypothetical protein
MNLLKAERNLTVSKTGRLTRAKTSSFRQFRTWRKASRIYNPPTVGDLFEVSSNSPVLRLVDDQMFCIQNAYHPEIKLSDGTTCRPEAYKWNTTSEQGEVTEHQLDRIDDRLDLTWEYGSTEKQKILFDRYKREVMFLILDRMTLYQTWMKGYYLPEIQCFDGSWLTTIVSPILGIVSPIQGAGADCTNGGQFPQMANLQCTQRLEYSKPSGWFSNDLSSETSTHCLFSYLPAHTSLLEVKTGICHDYAVAVVTLVRLAGFSDSDVILYEYVPDLNPQGAHTVALIKMPFDSKYTIIDTTTNDVYYQKTNDKTSAQENTP